MFWFWNIIYSISRSYNKKLLDNEINTVCIKAGIN